MWGFWCFCLSALAVRAGSVTSGPYANTEQPNDESDRISLPPIEDEPIYLCGEGRCTCQGSYAWCYSNLSYIPQLPSDITILDFQNNRLTVLSDSTFVNVTHVTELYLISNEIAEIKSTAFWNVPNLHVLDLSSNLFSCEDLLVVLNNPTIEKLTVWYTLDCVLETGITKPMPRLQELDLSRNPIRVFDLQILTPFTGLRRLILAKVLSALYRSTPSIRSYEALFLMENLTFLDLSENTLSCDDLEIVLAIPTLVELIIKQGTSCASDIDIVQPFTTSKLVLLNLSGNFLNGIRFHTYTGFNYSSFSNLRYIDLSYNRLAYLVADFLPQLQVLNMRGNIFSLLPETCTKDGYAYFPSLVELDFSENKLVLLTVQYDGRPVCLKKLRKFNLSKNLLSFLNFSMYEFAADWFASLEELDVSSQSMTSTFVQGINSTSFRFPRLKSLILDQNRLDFTDETHVNIGSFSGCPQLKHISLVDNSFKGMREERFHMLFAHLVYLQNISLRSTGLTHISAGMFLNLTSLEQLDLSLNSLAVLPNAAFQLAPHLAIINMSFNKITVIEESAFPLATRQRLQHIDLSANPIVCSCDVLWFRKWLISNPSLFGESSSDYMCANFVDTPIQSFFMQEQACLLTPETSKFIIATVSLIFIGMNLVFFLYRYRWHIRLLLFEARARGNDFRLRHLREHHFEYDLFVAYDSEDFPWVRDHLIPNVEGRLGLKLCLHQRDFILGNPIVDNIEESVESSKKMLMLFSRNFAQSEWCQFELRLCLRHAMDTEDVLLVVMLGDIPSRDLSPAMMAVMKTTTYIEWADDADVVDSFWRRMRLAVHEVLPDPQGDRP